MGRDKMQGVRNTNKVMETTYLINKINTAFKLEDVLNVENFKEEFNQIMFKIHPDKCSLTGAADATFKMNGWKNIYENGKIYKDDAGEFKTNGYWLEIKSGEKNLDWSIDNYKLFQGLKSDTDKHFFKYLPKECKLLSDGIYRYTFLNRAIPLSGLELPQEHVNWVLNRLLEYCSYLSKIGFVHCGLTPESVFITPENHGIQIVSWYHLTRINNKIGTVSGKYKNWYPARVFSDKVATPDIDIECSKRIAAYLLGDKSGNGGKFRKTHNADFINFLLSHSDSSYKTLLQYKELLDKNFKKEFYLLNI